MFHNVLSVILEAIVLTSHYMRKMLAAVTCCCCVLNVVLAKKIVNKFNFIGDYTHTQKYIFNAIKGNTTPTNY